MIFENDILFCAFMINVHCMTCLSLKTITSETFLTQEILLTPFTKHIRCPKNSKKLHKGTEIRTEGAYMSFHYTFSHKVVSDI